jgi:hypothetical protein
MKVASSDAATPRFLLGFAFGEQHQESDQKADRPENHEPLKTPRDGL